MAEARKVYTVIGLMSGTSMDGIDVAMIKTDGIDYIEPVRDHSIPYDDVLRNSLRQCLGKSVIDEDIRRVERDLTVAHVNAVKAMIDYEEVELIGFHGQSIFHDPDHACTIQIGDGKLLAEQTGISVVNDFRSNDMRHGGQGAPLLPLYHRARANNLDKPVAVLNLGGVGNVTYLGGDDDEILAFDTGPANALIDDFVFERTGDRFDKDGALAASGAAHMDLVHGWMEHSYFSALPPKSLDRDDWDVSGVAGLSAPDGAATLSEFTVRSVAAGFGHLPKQPRCCYVSGGGRHNKYIMARLREVLNCDVRPVDGLGWNGDALEAEGFAYLAVRSVLGLPLSLPGTTGVSEPVSGGTLYEVERE